MRSPSKIISVLFSAAKIVLIYFPIGFALLLAGCALPTPDKPSEFVRDKEIFASKIARSGMAQLNRGQLIDAELSFRQALYLYPKLYNLKLNLATTLGKQGQLEEAQTLFEELIETSKTPWEIRIAQADMFYAAADFQRARRYYLESYQLASKANALNVVASLNRSLAVLAFKMGDEQEALCRSQEAYSLQPSPDEAYRHARMLLALNHVKSASELFAQIAFQQAGAKPGPLTEPRLLYLAGLNEFAQGNFESALKNSISSLDLGVADFGLEAEVVLLGNLARKALGIMSSAEQESVEFPSLEELGVAKGLYLPPALLEQVLLAGVKKP